MSDVGVIGGGPAGLSAALFTQKNGLDTVVFDSDKTWMHQAHLFNYPGIGSVDGDVYLNQLRSQVELFGAAVRYETKVEKLNEDGDTFLIETNDEKFSVQYVVMATGTDRTLAEGLGCDFSGELVDVGLDMETSVGNAYATGAMVRDQEWQAIISAGDGAAASLNILSKEKGESFHDFDTPRDAESVLGRDGG